MPALHRRNGPNCRPMVDGGMKKCSAGACPPLGSVWGVAESTMPIRRTKSQLPLLIRWCTGGNRHEQLVRESALQSTSMPALHRRNGPNCRPMVDGGMKKCSAGACPPLGSVWGVAESTMPIRRTKSQLPLLIRWCTGGNRHEQLVRESALQSTSMPALLPRNVLNRRPMVDGGMKKCNAVEDYARRGACPPLGSGWGVAALGLTSR